MIITCEKCATSFNLDDSLIKEAGSKCRCSQCKHVFTVYPSPLEEEKDEGLFSSEPDTEASSIEFDVEDDDLSFDEDSSFDADDSDPGAETSSGIDLDVDDTDLDAFQTDAPLEDDDIVFEEAFDDDLDMESPDEGVVPLDEDGQDDDFEMDDISFSDSDDFDIDDADDALDTDDDLEIDDTGIDFNGAGFDMGAGEDTDALAAEVEDTDADSDDEFSFGEGDLVLEEEGTGDDDGLEMETLELEDDGLEFDFEGGEDTDATDDIDDKDDIMAAGVAGIAAESDEDIEADTLMAEDPDGIEFTPLEMDDDEAVDDEFTGSDGDISEIEDAVEEGFEPEKTVIEEDDFEIEFDADDSEQADDSKELETETADDDVLSMTLDESGVDETVSEEAVEEEEVEEEETDLDSVAVSPAADEFSEYDEVLDQETEPEQDAALDEDEIEESVDVEDITEEEFEEEPSPEEEVVEEKESPMLIPPEPPRRKQKKSGIGTPILVVLLLICLLVIGAYIASLMTGYKIPVISDIQIPFIEQYIKKPAARVDSQKPVPNQQSVNGRFVTNSSAGTLFVITGRVENPASTAYRYIQINGALITTGKKEAKSKKVFCGNVIPEEMLKTGSMADIDKMLVVKSGSNDLNSNVKPKTSVPFMIVFSDLPEKLQNFTVKVVGFEKVPN